MKITTRASTLLLVFAAVAAAQSQDRYPVDWRAVTPEIMQHFEDVLRIDTSNPPGNESKAAAFLQQILEKEGIPCKQFALEPSRANLVARIKGNGSKRPILVMGHTDVVTTQRDKWTFDPFSPTHKGGYVYAR